jgi:Ni2+-binding GTPase involved in maturation of urease and hydrogenase
LPRRWAPASPTRPRHPAAGRDPDGRPAGAGKTTSTAKLAKHLIERRKKKVLTVSADVYRPAAIQQLQDGHGQAGATWFESTSEQKPQDIALAALDHARRHHFDVLLSTPPDGWRSTRR